jgi:hypothetical protein
MTAIVTGLIVKYGGKQEVTGWLSQERLSTALVAEVLFLALAGIFLFVSVALDGVHQASIKLVLGLYPQG